MSRIRDVRLLCLAGFGYGGCALGLLGYVPLFLREAGWPGFQADLALSAFHFRQHDSYHPALTAFG